MFSSPFFLSFVFSFTLLLTAGYGQPQQRYSLVSAVPMELSFVSVGNLRNPPDSNGKGSVDATFSMGAYDVTAKEYCRFLNAVAKHRDPYKLYHFSMQFDPIVLSLQRTGQEGDYTYTPIHGREKMPITYVTLYSAARFCNWLHNGQPLGDEGNGTTETGAYNLKGTQSGPLIRTENAAYFLPTDDEWYKTAYYNASQKNYYAFPNRSYWSPKNSHDIRPYNNEANYSGHKTQGDEESDLRLTPVGYFSTSMSPYGAFDMGGNVSQWTETSREDDPTGMNFIIRGGSW